MAMHAVNWQEGMFLRPHHFQTGQRYLAEIANRHAKWDVHYNWGVRGVELDLEALANHRAVVRAVKARFRDGTLLSVPEDCELAPLPLKQAMAQQSSVTLYLAVPTFSLGQANVAVAGNPFARFLVENEMMEDENTGINPQPIPVRRLQAKLLLSTQDLSRNQVLPLARLEKSQRAEAAPQLDETFIPPTLACDAWAPLQVGILQAIYERIGKKIDVLAGQASQRGINFDTRTQGDALVLHQLRELNEAFTVLGVLAFAEGVHPRRAHQELCRIAGQLAVFGALRRTPELPKYDHDDPAAGFRQLKMQIDGLLDIVVEPQFKERPFEGAGMRIQAPLEPNWLEATWHIFVGVRCPLEPQDTVDLLTKRGLDMKIGSSDRVDAIFRQGGAGLKFAHVARPPRELPMPPGQVYLQIANNPQDAEWQHVQKALTMAIRLNENFVAGNIHGQRTFHIKHAGKTVPTQFTLYLVPTAKKS